MHSSASSPAARGSSAERCRSDGRSEFAGKQPEAGKLWRVRAFEVAGKEESSFRHPFKLRGRRPGTSGISSKRCQIHGRFDVAGKEAPEAMDLVRQVLSQAEQNPCYMRSIREQFLGTYIKY